MKLCDRPNTELRLEQTALDWIREHEPNQVGVLEFATIPRARFYHWSSRILLANGLVLTGLVFLLVWQHPNAIAPMWQAFGGMAAGLTLGVSQQLSAGAHSTRLLALLKGEGMKSEQGVVHPDNAGAR